jgi:glycosyltransferase involved in cell wall biosynthesis
MKNEFLWDNVVDRIIEVYKLKNTPKNHCNAVISTKKKKPNVCIITTPRFKASITPLSNLVKIISSLSAEVFLITGNEGAEIFNINKNIRGISISHEVKKRLFRRILNYIFLQLKISYEITKIKKNIDSSIFFMGEGLLLPALTLKFLKKPIILSLAASSSKMLDSQKNLQSILKLPKYLEIMNYILSDKIVIYSSNLIPEWGLYRYQNKIRICHEHILDFNELKLEKKCGDKGFVIGYIGRFSEEKGVMNFIESIPRILKEKPSLNVLIMGEGELKSDIETYIMRNNLKNNVKLTGWIHHENIPQCLNLLKLLIIPSYTEGLPNIMLEAMACGAPVLATRVGAIPEIIKDTKTGFLMENNSPECIAENIIRGLEYPYLEKIAENARSLVKHQFTIEAAIERYSTVFENITGTYYEST